MVLYAAPATSTQRRVCAPSEHIACTIIGVPQDKYLVYVVPELREFNSATLVPLAWPILLANAGFSTAKVGALHFHVFVPFCASSSGRCSTHSSKCSDVQNRAGATSWCHELFFIFSPPKASQAAETQYRT